MTEVRALPSKKSPLYDLTCINAVQSYLIPEGSLRDPWGVTVAGQLADLLIYADEARFSMPIGRGDIAQNKMLTEPRILRDIYAIDSSLATASPYFTEEFRQLSGESVDEAFGSFTKWAQLHPKKIREFSRLHQQSWINKYHQARVANNTVYDLSTLSKSTKLASLADSLAVGRESLLYCFDIVLRTPIYGEMTGEQTHYLNHPLRNAFKISGSTINKRPAHLPVSFASTFESLLPKLTREHYFALIGSNRENVQKFDLASMRSWDINRDYLREFAACARIPPRLRHRDGLTDSFQSVLALLTAYEMGGPIAAAATCLVTVFASACKESRPLHLPASAGDISWLKWAIEWEIEKQAK
jgi:hypothetical protein